MGTRVLHYSDVENAYDRPGRIGRLAGLLSRRDGGDALTVGTGDVLAPGVLSLVTDGWHAMDFFEAVQPDVATFGNHDFDVGRDALRAIVSESPQTWLGANVYDDGERFGVESGVLPSTIVDVQDERLGFVGVLSPATPSMSPGAASLEVTDPVAAVERQTDRLRAAGADHVVVLSHTGDDEPIARSVDVDAVLGGHVHEPRTAEVDGTLLARPGANARYLMEVDLGAETVERHAVSGTPMEAEVRDALDRRLAENGLTEVVATVEDPVRRDRSLRTCGECRIGNFVADAYRWASGADVALQNTGGIRRGPPLSGQVTVADLVGIVPFDEPVVVVELTGSDLETLAAQADGADMPGLADYWHAHVSGMTIRHDGSAAAVTVDGEPPDPDAMYTLATTKYVTDVDHEFPVIDSDQVVETLEVQYDVLVDYADARGIDPDTDGRVTCRY